MTYDICFDAASLFIMLVITFGSGRNYIGRSLRHSRFRRLCGILTAALVIDIVSVVTISYPTFLPVKVNAAIQAVFFLLLSATIYTYTRYMETFVKTSEMNKVFRIINTCVYCLYIALHIANIFGGFIFYFDEQLIYQKGSFYFIVIVVPVYLYLYGLMLFCTNRKLLNHRQFYAAVLLMPIMLVGVVVDVLILPYHEITLFAMTFGVLIIFLYLETPDYQKLQSTLKQLEQAKLEAERSSTAKSNFLAQMSHEIRTPINAVLGMNEMILRESREEATLEYASNAYNAGNALLSVINDILDISKIEAGKLEITKSDYELYSLINDCCNLISDRAEKKELIFSCDIDEELPSKLSGDVFHIRQIAVNLLTNAVKYTDKGSVKLIVSGEKKDDSFLLRISVKDTGIGIDDESREKLFTSFQRFDLERNRAVEGTGLGLSISKQLADLMGGSIDVMSIYGEGSTFSLSVPQEIVDETPIGKVSPLHSSKTLHIHADKTFIARDAHILVVDDVEMNLIVFKSLLKEHELIIDTADSSKKCLELIQDQKYDVIFMDHMMPEMDGIETFAVMRKTEHPNKDTPVVMLTANAISGERDRYLSEGFASYLTKPIQSDRLEKTLLNFLPQDKVEWIDNNEPSDTASANDGGMDSRLIDTALGMSYCADSESVYTEVLQSYVKGGEKMLADIRRCRESKDLNCYVIEVHALKGMSLSIGAKRLSEAAKELELAGKNGEYELIDSKTDDMLRLYERVLDEGRRYLDKRVAKADTAASGDVTEISLGAFSEYIEKIKAACLEYDGGKVGALCDEAGAYSCRGTALKPMLDELKYLAEDFECEEAARKASEIHEKIAAM